MRAWITTDPLDPAALLDEVIAAENGAALLFVGVVRRENEGRPVTGMRYDAYREMAARVLGEIVRAAATRAGTEHIAAVHRIGELKVGEASIAIAVASAHRDEAYQASRFIIEQVKQRLPVWKQEHYANGETEWLAGSVPPLEEAGRE